MTRTIGTAVLGLLVLAMLAGCGRKQFVVTECIGASPAIERTLDVAPPNCAD